MQRLWKALADHGHASGSAVYEALCSGLAARQSGAVADLFGRFYRIVSAELPNPPLFLAALHHLALSGEAPSLAAHFPSCGGAWNGDTAVVDAAEADLATGWEAVLDFMLSHDLQPHSVERSATVLVGAMAAVQRLGGGISLVDLGCAGGLNLLFDRYSYRFDDADLGASPLRLQISGRIGGLQAVGMPRVTGRYGLDPYPRDLRDPSDRLLLASFIAPDHTEQLTHFRTAADLLAAEGGLDLRTGEAETDLFSLLVEAYTAMPVDHTLLVVDTFVWAYLTDPQRQMAAHAIQRLAAGLTARKPMAWLQFEPVGAGLAELKLHTFGWADQEDRAVVRLAEAHPLASWIRMSDAARA